MFLLLNDHGSLKPILVPGLLPPPPESYMKMCLVGCPSPVGTAISH